jgi:hypothetical protein
VVEPIGVLYTASIQLVGLLQHHLPPYRKLIVKRAIAIDADGQTGRTITVVKIRDINNDIGCANGSRILIIQYIYETKWY